MALSFIAIDTAGIKRKAKIKDNLGNFTQSTAPERSVSAAPDA